MTAVPEACLVSVSFTRADSAPIFSLQWELCCDCSRHIMPSHKQDRVHKSCWICLVKQFSCRYHIGHHVRIAAAHKTKCTHIGYSTSGHKDIAAADTTHVMTWWQYRVSSGKVPTTGYNGFCLLTCSLPGQQCQQTAACVHVLQEMPWPASVVLSSCPASAW